MASIFETKDVANLIFKLLDNRDIKMLALCASKIRNAKSSNNILCELVKRGLFHKHSIVLRCTKNECKKIIFCQNCHTTETLDVLKPCQECKRLLCRREYYTKSDVCRECNKCNVCSYPSQYRKKCCSTKFCFKHRTSSRDCSKCKNRCCHACSSEIYCDKLYILCNDCGKGVKSIDMQCNDCQAIFCQMCHENHCPNCGNY